MPDVVTAQQKPAAKSRHHARAEVLPVAQIYRAVRAEPQGTATMLTVVVGDENTEPKQHGLRASHDDWCRIFAQLRDADPVLGERLRAL